MNILHLISYSLYSGPVPPTLGLARAQRQAGHTVWLAHDRLRGNFDGYEESAGEKLVAAHLGCPWPMTLSAKARPWQTFRDLRVLAQVCRERRVDVVHCHMSHDHLLMTLVGPPGVAVVRTIHAERSLKRRFGQNLVMARSSGVIARCATHHQQLAARFGLPPQRLAIIPSGIDAKRFAPGPQHIKIEQTVARGRYGLPFDVPLIGQVGLLAQRGQEELLHAVQRLSHVRPHVALAGKGKAEDELRRLACRLGLQHRVHFLGYVPDANLPELYASFDAAFVAQAGNDAGVRGALEAMASGLPLLAVTGGSMGSCVLGELVNSQRGYPVDSRHPADIAAALALWLADPAAAHERGAAARAFVQQERSFEREAAATLRFYLIAQAMNGRRNAPTKADKAVGTKWIHSHDNGIAQ